MIQKSTIFENDRTALKITGQVARVLDLRGNQFAVYRKDDGESWNRMDVPSTFPAPYSFGNLKDLGSHFIGSGLDLVD